MVRGGEREIVAARLPAACAFDATIACDYNIECAVEM